MDIKIQKKQTQESFMGDDKQIIISVVIVNWNSKDFLAKCLRTVFNSVTKLPFEVIVVDNASYDGSEEMVKLSFPQVRFFQLDKNIGFAGANNFGSKKAKGKILHFLNPDTEIEPDVINTLAELILLNNDTAIAGCKICNRDGSVQLSTILQFPTLFREIIDNEFLMKRFYWLNLWGNSALFERKKVIVKEVEVISGACLAINRDDFFKVGGFNESYFMYSEEVELCYRVKKRGKKVKFTNKCKIMHYGGGSSRLHPVKEFSIKMIFESRMKFIQLNYGFLHAVAYKISVLLTAIVKLSLIITFSPVFLLVSKQQLAYSLKKWIYLFIWVFSGCRVAEEIPPPLP